MLRTSTELKALEGYHTYQARAISALRYEMYHIPVHKHKAVSSKMYHLGWKSKTTLVRAISSKGTRSYNTSNHILQFKGSRKNL